MAKKKSNNLIKLTIGERVYYYTSKCKAGMKVNLAPSSVIWALKYHNELWSNNDEKITFEEVDGSEVPYKMIDNL